VHGGERSGDGGGGGAGSEASALSMSMSVGLSATGAAFNRLHLPHRQRLRIAFITSAVYESLASFLKNRKKNYFWGAAIFLEFWNNMEFD